MKDFDWVIGKQVGELTILSYTPPLKELRHQRNCTCLCSCGKQVVKRLSRVLGEEVKSCKDKAMSNSQTGIRNIAKAENGDGYRVYLRRHGKYYRKRAKTLAEALLVKKELIKQAERDFGEVIYKD